TLSRAPLREHALNEIDNDLSLHCDLLMKSINLSDSLLSEIRENLINDESLQKVISYIKNGWPSNKKLVDTLAMPYYNIKDDLSFINQLLLKNNRIIIPHQLRHKTLNSLHEGHMGIQRCQNLAKSSVYWPNINHDIFNLVSSCEICAKYKNCNGKQELLPHDIIELPWYKVACDIFEFEKKQYLLVVDYYSKYIEIDILNMGYSSKHVITKLKSIYARHGIPKIFVSDNGPPYNSKEFNQFCNDWSIEHITSSPHFPRSNGMAERSVQIVKKLLIKCKETNSDYYTALLHYRTTPKGEDVMFKRTPLSVWYPATVVEKCKEPRSFLVEDNDGVIYRRNREHLMKRQSVLDKIDEERETVNPNQSPVIDLNLNNEKSANQYVTQRGRNVVAPNRLKYE
ncbi:uncharacterized protein K02A2.6-like, partial [Teleopsis dalmanni]|uniref:uncharacterized protein K02A2.6-like n=1 Tax=Teleopsis dalmanni TaxID=139649 RepID=UPI0018CD20EB